MDFIVSKVAMSICALLVVGILGGMFGPGGFLDSRTELSSVVDQFCATADAVALSPGESSVSWTVPYASDGTVIVLELDGSLVRASWGSQRAVGQPACDIRTWSLESGELNSTELAVLDESMPELEASSGQTIEIMSRIVLSGNEELRLVFASVPN